MQQQRMQQQRLQQQRLQQQRMQSQMRMQRQQRLMNERTLKRVREQAIRSRQLQNDLDLFQISMMQQRNVSASNSGQLTTGQAAPGLRRFRGLEPGALKQLQSISATFASDEVAAVVKTNTPADKKGLEGEFAPLFAFLEAEAIREKFIPDQERRRKEKPDNVSGGELADQLSGQD
jgi:hypothetical protein